MSRIGRKISLAKTGCAAVEKDTRIRLLECELISSEVKKSESQTKVHAGSRANNNMVSAFPGIRVPIL